MDNKKGQHRMGDALFLKCIFYHEQQEPGVLQLEQPPPKSIPDVTLKPK
ncbi:MAG: hypothetical protein ACNYWU_07360 [Desulfobacterales bacterium]